MKVLMLAAVLALLALALLAALRRGKSRTNARPTEEDQPQAEIPQLSRVQALAQERVQVETPKPALPNSETPAGSGLGDGFDFLGLGDLGNLAPVGGWLDALRNAPERLRGLSVEGSLALIYDDSGNSAAVALGEDVGGGLDLPFLRGLRLDPFAEGARLAALPRDLYIGHGGRELKSGAALRPGLLYGLGVGAVPTWDAQADGHLGGVLGAPSMGDFMAGGLDVRLARHGRPLSPNLDPARAALIFQGDALDVGQAYEVPALRGLRVLQDEDQAHLGALPAGISVLSGANVLAPGTPLERGARYRLAGTGADGLTLEWRG